MDKNGTIKLLHNQVRPTVNNIVFYSKDGESELTFNKWFRLFIRDEEVLSESKNSNDKKIKYKEYFKTLSAQERIKLLNRLKDEFWICLEVITKNKEYIDSISYLDTESLEKELRILRNEYDRR